MNSLFIASANVPEVPNFFTLLSRHVHTDAANLLLYWENIIFSIGAAIALTLLFRWGLKNHTLIPRGMQNFLEWIVELIRKSILDILGPEGEKFVPFLGTLFLYILLMNWLVLLPFFKAPSSSINITLALALCVFSLVQYLNIRNYGIFGFLYHLAGSPKDIVGWVLSPMMFVLELLTQFTRPLTLSLRLFGNIFGEDVLIGTFSLFGVAMLAHWNAPVGFPLQVPFLFLALFTGLLQALVFTYLSTIYILLSAPHEE